MPTTVTSSIGSAGGRNYSTLQAWEDASPANLVTDDKIWKGECYNDSEFSSAGTLLTISGITTDATRYVWLTTAAGQSFVDHANKLTNALEYNQTFGVGISSSSDYGGRTIDTAAVSNTLIEKLQIRHTRVGAGGNGALNGVYTTIKNCILSSKSTSQPLLAGNNNTAVNCLMLSTNFTVFNGDGLLALNAYNCTIVNLGSAAHAFRLDYGTTTRLNNCAVYGFVTGVLHSGSGITTSSNHNSTDKAAPTNWGANSQNTRTFASQFVNTASDFRAKTGADLINAGTRDQTNTADLDIVGQARSITTPTIGCWEVVASGSAFIASKPFMVKQGVNRASTY